MITLFFRCILKFVTSSSLDLWCLQMLFMRSLSHHRFVSQPKDMTFEFPNLMPEEKKQEKSDQMKEIDRVRDTYKKDQDKFKDRPGVPTWFN